MWTGGLHAKNSKYFPFFDGEFKLWTTYAFLWKGESRYIAVAFSC